MTERISWTCLALVGLLASGCDDGPAPTPDAGTEDAQIAPGCPAGTTECRERCVDTSNDRESCGACDNACAAGEACVDGACSILCPAGQIECDGICVDTDSDRRHCGACAAACDAGEICAEGSCEVSCPAGQTLCDGLCADTSSNPAHCSGCGNACESGEVCSAGVCAVACSEGLTECGGACVDTANDPEHCGACDDACPVPSGASGLCMAGGCRAVCDALAGDCNGDLSSATSDGCETPLATDPMNCGVCNAVCSLTNATAGCDAGGCVVAACDAGFDDCDGADANGCEIELAADDLNCGACGNACAAGSRCTDGTCTAILAEDCATPFALSPGTNSVAWNAVNADYLTANPSCVSSSYSLLGPDLVLSYTATADQRVTLELAKPENTRWVAVVSTEACGTPTPSLACISDSAPATMSGSFQMTAGQTAYVYVRDTSSGSLPLDQPLTVDVTAVDCTDAPPVTFDPPNGGTTDRLTASFTATFAAPVISTSGTVTITGDMGTSLSYDLSTLPSQVTFTSGNTVMTVSPGVSLPPGEALTLGWSGLSAVVCTTPVAVPAPTWGVNVIVPPCSPGAGGVVGTTVTRTPTGLSSITEYYIVPDTSPTGFVYFGGTSDLYRMPKAGGVVEDLNTLAGLTSTHLGYSVAVAGSEVYTLDNGTGSNRLYRITRDGGSTWSIENYAAFSSTPTASLEAMTVYDGRLYMATGSSSTTDTQVWSVPTSATTLPVTATLEASFTGLSSCNGFDRDGSSYYFFCNTNDRVIRLPAASGSYVVVSDQFDSSAVKNTIWGDDLDSDGTFDVLYQQGQYEEIGYICAPAGTPFADRLVDVGGSSGNYGLGFDPVNNVLYMVDDDTREIISVQ